MKFDLKSIIEKEFNFGRLDLNSVSAFLLIKGSAAVILLMGCSGAVTQPVQNSRMIVNVAKLEPRNNYEVQKSFVGRVEAKRTSEIGFELSGKVLSVEVEEGNRIEAGGVVAVLDTDILDARRKEAQASLDKLSADQKLAELTLQRTQRAHDLEAVSDQQLDDAQQALVGLTAAAIQAAASLKVIDVELEKSVIKSPYNALVSRRFIDEGRVVEAGTPIVTVMEMGKPEARIGIAGNSVKQLKIGESHTLVVQGREVEAHIKAILPIRDVRSRSVDVLFDLELSIEEVRDGDLVTLNLKRSIQERGAWVPIHALAENSRGLWALYILKNIEAEEATLVRENVELLYYEGERAFVRGALMEQTFYVIDGLHKLVPQQLVRFREISYHSDHRKDSKLAANSDAEE
ncbi:MAG: efflux RND transporter periplasmic adaptor subunit [Verrucomicrobiota bacterium]